ncbi:AAEL009773-PC [Aedes aegypti]|uniref:AAEL009773-PC n=2 Tax=Aedes aegypti TaxID=7159 RepID=Q16UW6_AEDAE|nr:AAEL009773-PC [Aedes aegypti]
MSASTGKVVIPVESPAEQEEHLRNARKLLKDVQNVPAMNKENVGKLNKLPMYLSQAHKELAKKSLFSDALESIELKRKKTTTVQSQSSQTSPEKKPATVTKPTITAEDLTSLEGPSEQYWEVLAERRRLALEESLAENQELYEKVSSLEEELNLSKEMLQEARNLVEVLTELLQEGEAEKEEAAAAGSSKEGVKQVDDSGVAPEPELPSDDEDLFPLFRCHRSG